MKTIIFDFGNVVGFFEHRRAVDKLVPFTSLTPEEMIASVFGGPLEDQVERGHVTPAVFLTKVHEMWQLRCDIDLLTHAVSDIFWINPEVCDLIPKLKRRYRILLGSNTNELHAGQFRKQFADVLSHFDALVLSHEIGTRKPDAAFFRHCHGLAQADVSECVFVDDLASNIAGARAVGFHGIQYQPGAGLSDQLRALGVEIGPV